MAKKESKKKTEAETVEELEAQEIQAEVEVEEGKAPTELEKSREQLEQLNDRLLRTLAEYDNYRKRSQKEKEQAYSDSKASTLSEFLPVLDNFERAVNNKDASYEDYQKGVEMIFSQLGDIFKKLGVEPFGEKGEEFDPNLHSAVMHIDDENEKENVIVDVFAKGYKAGDRIIRPAMVKVAN